MLLYNETYDSYVSLLVSMFSLKKELGIAKVICKGKIYVTPMPI